MHMCSIIVYLNSLCSSPFGNEADDIDKEKVDDDKNEQNENLSITKQDNGQSLLFQFCPDPSLWVYPSLSRVVN